MPYTMTKINGKWKVVSPHGTKAKGTSKRKGESQMRLLRGIEHGWTPTKGK